MDKQITFSEKELKKLKEFLAWHIADYDQEPGGDKEELDILCLIVQKIKRAECEVDEF